MDCFPVFRDWGAYDVVHVYDSRIVPDATYKIEVADQRCQAMMAELPESTFSDSLIVNTSQWGDVIGFNCNTCPCSPPQRGQFPVTITDVLAILGKFSNDPCAIIKSRADIDPDTPNLKVGITDVLKCNLAFSGNPYPFPGPVPCN